MGSKRRQHRIEIKPEYRIEIKPEWRGFLRGEFKDEQNIPCMIQESSFARDRDCIWLGIRDRTECMHLTKEHAAALIPILIHFATTGRLPQNDEQDDG